MEMKTILPFKPAISRLFCIAGITVAGSSLAGGAGAELTYPGAPLDENGRLFPQDSLSDNTVIITGGSIPGNAYGAKTTDGDTVRNRITMTGGAVNHLLGGYSETGTVKNNSVLLNGGAVARNIYGGESSSGAVLDNSVTMTSGSANWVLGAYTDTGLAKGNLVIISGGTLSGGVSGAETFQGDALENSVQFSNITASYVNGGRTETGRAVGNTLVINSGTIQYDVYGGVVANGSGEASANIVVVNGGEIGLETSGASSYHSLTGGYSSDGKACGNQVMVHGGKIANIDGGFSSGGTVDSPAESVASGNSIFIDEGVVEGYVRGGYSILGVSSHNTVKICAGVIGGDVYGGLGAQGTASHNTVEIRGGTVKGNVYGGRGDWDYNRVKDPGSATYNTVILGGNPNLSQSCIAGGDYFYASDIDVKKGNTLILDDFHGAVREIKNFEHYIVRLSSWAADGTSLLTVQQESTSGPPLPTDLSGATFRLEVSGFSPDGPRPFIGDTISLIRNEDGLATNGMILETPAVSNIRHGIAWIYDVSLSVGDTSIDATVTSSRLNPQLKSLSEGRAAAMALNNQGADLVAGLGISRAAMAAMQGGSLSGMETFLAMEGSHSSYATGSHVDQDGYAVLAGVSAGFSENRSLVLGGFLESGWGSYTAHNAFPDAPFVRASGDTSYYGGGLLARWDLTEYGLRGIALEASFRAGRLDSDYHSGDLTDGAGNPSAYDLSSPYYGGHAGAAWARQLSRKVNVEAYGRFLWTRQDGDHATISGDHIRFRDMNSSRLQGGARFHYEMAPTIRPYAGAAYEWECNGTARAAVYGQDIGTPTLRGGTGIAEVGVVFQPAAGKPMFVDLGVKGYAGKREGVSGSLQFRAAF